MLFSVFGEDQDVIYVDDAELRNMFEDVVHLSLED